MVSASIISPSEYIGVDNEPDNGKEGRMPGNDNC